MPSPWVQRRFERRVAFEVSESELRSLDKMLSALGAACQVSLYTTDNAELTYFNLEEALAFPNADSRMVRKVLFWNPKPTENGLRVRVRLSATDEPFSDNVSFELDGEDQATYLAEMQLVAWLNQQRPWWRWLVEKPLLTWFANFVVVTALIAVVHQFGPFQHHRSDDYWALLIESCIGLAGWAMSYLVAEGWQHRWHRYLFPLGTIAFGYGLARKQAKDRWRNFVLVGILLAIATNIAAAAIWEWRPETKGGGAQQQDAGVAPDAGS